MDGVVIVQRDESQPRKEFNQQVLQVAAAVFAGSAATFARAYTIDGEAVPLQEKIAAEQPPLCDAVFLAHGGGALELAERLVADMQVTSPQVYGAQIRHLKNDPPACIAGGRSDGLFMVTPTRKTPGMSHDDFDAHWYNNHTPLALRHHPGMRDYYQIPFFEQRQGQHTGYDGLSLMGFASQQAFLDNLFDSDEGKAIIEADIARFLDFEGIFPAFMVESILE